MKISESNALFLNTANLLFSLVKNGPVAYILRSFTASPQISASLLPLVSLPLSLPPSLSLWAFELISAGSPCCLIGHEAVYKQKIK